MKQSLLICFFSILAAVADGQEAKTSLLNEQNNSINNNRYPDGINMIGNDDAPMKTEHGARTTAYNSRWYNYTDTFLNFAYRTSACHPVTHTSSFLIPLWSDTTALFGNPDGTYINNKIVSTGLDILPFDNFWNLTYYFALQMAVHSTNATSLDSILISGIYGRNYTTPAKRAVIDTLIIGVVYGTGLPASDINSYFLMDTVNYCRDTLRYLQIFHDSLNNHVANSPGSTAFSERTFTYYLHESDTFSSSKSFPILPTYNIPPGNMVSASVSFKSGDNTYPSSGSIPRDTIQYSSSGNYKYGSLQPRVYYSSTGGLSPQPKFMHDSIFYDHSCGFFKDMGSQFHGWGGYYMPHWLFKGITDTSASKLQFPAISYHITCIGCVLVEDIVKTTSINNIHRINTYPVPANDELNFDFNLNMEADVRIVLKNMMGQVVGSKQLGSSLSGKASIDTRELPNGVYFYEFYAGEGYETGKVIVAH